jgi:hypothetical protein
VFGEIAGRAEGHQCVGEVSHRVCSSRLLRLQPTVIGNCAASPRRMITAVRGAGAFLSVCASSGLSCVGFSFSSHLGRGRGRVLSGGDAWWHAGLLASEGDCRSAERTECSNDLIDAPGGAGLCLSWGGDGG